MRRSPFQLIAVAALAVALLTLRDSDTFLRPDFWAEDGRAFFGGWNALGWASLLEPKAGYLHLMPRTVAAVAGLLPLGLVPAPIHYGSWKQGIRDGSYRYPPDKTVPVPRR
ncbi:hypothetical protein [Thalassobaculum sp.]|uniref:hypothetical protein n=1 Tax=Thalassobaculum sp. TaxID=2022740 RepID=UPI003B5A50A2